MIVDVCESEMWFGVFEGVCLSMSKEILAPHKAEPSQLLSLFFISTKATNQPGVAPKPSLIPTWMDATPCTLVLGSDAWGWDPQIFSAGVGFCRCCLISLFRLLMVVGSDFFSYVDLGALQEARLHL